MIIKKKQESLKSCLQIDFSLLESVSNIMCTKGLTVSVAESCTGGFVSTCLTAQSGASKFFNGSVTTYSDLSKNKILHIEAHDLYKEGVVSKQVS